MISPTRTLLVALAITLASFSAVHATAASNSSCDTTPPADREAPAGGEAKDILGGEAGSNGTATVKAEVHSRDLAAAGSLAVDLRSDQSSLVLLSGDWASIPDAKFEVSARRPWLPGSSVHGTREVWSTELLASEGLAELSFPFEGEYEFEPVVGEEFVWLFEPRSVYWSPGVQPQLLVQRIELHLWQSTNHY